MSGVPIAGARVLLTGASGGIGGAIARDLAGRGAVLVLSGRRRDALEGLAEQVGGRAICADLAERGAVRDLLAQAGPVDVLIACAALPGSGRLRTLEQAHVDRALEVNLRAPIALAHELAPSMAARGRGQLVFIGSISGRAGSTGASIYSATKFGLRGFAVSLRPELARSGVGVSLVEPGFVRDEGMYGDTAIKLPFGVGTRTAAQVAVAVAGAIEHNRGVVTVAPVPLAVGALIASVAPGFAATMARLAGGDRVALQFEAQQANKR